jgi:hypothetical protein
VIDMRSWAKKWNDASLRQIATLPENSSSRPWPLVGMFAIGVVAGAIGSFAVTQRSQIKRLARRALREGDGLDALAGMEIAHSSHRSNHRRKAASEVK